MKRQTGFTLIELMIAVVIAAILVGIAIPSYSNYVQRSNRTEGQAFLNDAAARQERFFTQNNAYVTTTASLGNLGMGGTSSRSGFYALTVAVGAATDGGYLLTATAQNRQASDTACSTLTLNAVGTRGFTGSGSLAECWR